MVESAPISQIAVHVSKERTVGLWVSGFSQAMTSLRDAEFHVHIGCWEKASSNHRGRRRQREQTLLVFVKKSGRIRRICGAVFSNLLDRISNECLPAVRRRSPEFRDQQTRKASAACHKFRQLSDARQVIVVRVSRRKKNKKKLAAKEVINADRFSGELLLKLDGTSRQGLGAIRATRPFTP